MRQRILVLTAYLGALVLLPRCIDAMCVHPRRQGTARARARKRIKNTLIYTHLVKVEDDSYVSRVAMTTKDICELVDEGFEYVCEHNGAKIFRKHK